MARADIIVLIFVIFSISSLDAYPPESDYCLGENEMPVGFDGPTELIHCLVPDEEGSYRQKKTSGVACVCKENFFWDVVSEKCVKPIDCPNAPEGWKGPEPEQ